MKYKYIGLNTVVLSQFNLTVEPEQVVEVETEIDNPNFEKIADSEPVTPIETVEEESVETEESEGQE